MSLARTAGPIPRRMVLLTSGTARNGAKGRPHAGGSNALESRVGLHVSTSPAARAGVQVHGRPCYAVPCDRSWWKHGGLVPGERQDRDVARRFFVRASWRWRAAPSKRRPAGTHLPHGHPGDRGGAGRASSQPAREQAAGAGPPGIDGRHCPMRGFGSLAGAARFGSAHDGDYRPSPPRGMPPVTHSGTTFPSGQGVDCQSVPCLPRPSNPHISRGSREHEGRWPRMPAERRICTIGCGEWRTGPNDVGTEQKHCSRALPLPPLACGRRVPGGQRWCFPCWEPHTRLGLAPK